jgi:hypothetical protein
MFLLISFVLLALSSAPKSVGNSQAVDCVTESGSDILHESVIPLFSAQAQNEPRGCCCLLKDAGPPPNWDCSGSTPGTMETKQQCAESANETGAKYKWHEGQCTGEE